MSCDVINAFNTGILDMSTSTGEIWSSSDAIEWEQVTGPQSDVFYTDVASIQYANGIYGIMGSDACDFWIGDIWIVFTIIDQYYNK